MNRQRSWKSLCYFDYKIPEDVKVKVRNYPNEARVTPARRSLALALGLLTRMFGMMIF